MDNNIVLRLEHVSVDRGRVRVLDDVSFDVPRRSCTMIIGPNGAGKTTLLMVLLGEIRSQGRVEFVRRPDGQPLRLGYVPQQISLDRAQPLTVEEFLCLSLQQRPVWLGLDKQALAKALQGLEAVQAAHLHQRKLGALSGGELQRVMLAQALQRQPDLLILDEATAGVDVHGDQLFCELLEELRAKYGFTQLAVSHDLGMVAHHATQVICLKNKVLAQGSPDQVFNDQVLTALFGIHMGLIPNRPGTAACQKCGAEHA